MYWRNLPKYKRNFREYREINMSMQKKWFENVVNNDKNTIMFSICDIKNDELLGCCGLCYINWIYRNAELSFYIGYKDSYIDKNGFSDDACKLLLDYGFDELNMHKIWTELYEYDTEKLSFFIDKFGFQKDGYLRDHHFADGRWWGSYIISLIRRDI